MQQQDGARRRRVAQVDGAQLGLGLSEPQQQRVQRLVKLLRDRETARLSGAAP